MHIVGTAFRSVSMQGSRVDDQCGGKILSRSRIEEVDRRGRPPAGVRGAVMTKRKDSHGERGRGANNLDYTKMFGDSITVSVSVLKRASARRAI